MSALADVFDLDDLEEVWVREYLRVSKDESGRARSNAEQHDENVAIADRKRWHLGEPYEDVGSASSRKRKRRPDFDQLMADLRGGTFGAHVLIIWEASRGSREVPEWYTLLGLCQQQQVFIFVTSLRRVFNPRVARDWKDLMTMAVDAEHEVMQMVERQGRANNADAGAGNWKGGRRPFGYEADGVTINEIEKSHILEAVERMLAGESPRSIAGDWNRRNIPTSAGNAWHPGALAKVLGSARIAGKRVHNKVVVGPAVWEGIIDEVTHKRVVAVLKSRTPVGRRGRTPWLLTGLLRCGHCEATLVGNTDSRNGVRRYVCRKAPGYHGCGKLGIKAEPLEDLLGFLVGDRSVDIAARRAAQTGPDDAAEQAELDELTVLRDEADEDRRTKKIDRAEFDRRVAKFDVWQRDIYARLAAKTVTAAPLDLLADEEFMGRPWKELTVTEKRRKLDALIVGVSVAPASSRGSTRFEAARVRGGIGWRI